MSRDFFPFDVHTISTDANGRSSIGNNGERTPHSNFSTGFESSTFGSGSSVLSSFEPPTDAELAEKTKMMQLLHDNQTFTGTLEELESLILRLQAVYYYRQRLQSLTGEVSSQGLQRGRTGEPRLSPPPGFGTQTTPQWEWNSRTDDSFTTAIRAVEAAATEMSATQGMVAPQHQAIQENFYQDTHPVTPSIRREGRRKSRRQQSCPVVCAQQWADPNWNPRAQSQTKTPTSHGTGFFLPQQFSNRNAATPR